MRHASSRDPHAPGLRALAVLLLAGLAATTLGLNCGTIGLPSTHEPVGHQSFTSPQVDAIVVSADGGTLYVANTTSDTIDIVDTGSFSRRAVTVGVEPVSLALRPDGSELWVSNHVSDSVSVVDLVPSSPTYASVIHTVQDLDPNGVTDFDEPAGIAFAGNDKAYVALSSRNEIAVVDATTYQVTGRLAVTAQEPRAIAVRGGRLYVAAFESSNQTELSACPDQAPGPSGSQCTLGVDEIGTFVLDSPNIPGEAVEIVTDPDVPDRDLFVYDTASDALVDVVTGVGTLLYGLTVDSAGRVFVTATDARNAENGLTGTNLVDLDNRMFLNQVVRVDCGGSCGSPTDFELEPLPPAQPAAGAELATPYGIAVSDDDSTLVAVAMGTSRLFTLDPGSGAVLGILDLDDGDPAAFGQQIPKAVALVSDGLGAPATAYVLNTLENTVSVVDVSNPALPVHVQKVAVGSDPTPDAVRRGRIAFANAFASTSGTFSCESCHPDSHTDQLLWRIGGPCFFGACSGDDEVRTTMPVKGLRNTLPLHWDGTLGDPFDGTDNGAFGSGSPQPASCTTGDADGDHDCFLHLVDASLGGVMCDQDPGSNPAGCPPGGHELSAAAADDMAVFLAEAVYAPPRARPADDLVSVAALEGFKAFFVDPPGGLFESDAGDVLGVTTCADMDSGCHALPLGADHSSSTLAGFDAPTMRGMTDRFIHFSLGITVTEETMAFAQQPRTISIQGFPLQYTGPVSPEFTWDPAVGYDERSSFGAAFLIFEPAYGVFPDLMFQMFEEASTGYSGALGRQVQLNAASTTGPALAATEGLLALLEAADQNGSVNLRGVGVRDGAPLVLSYRADGTYKNGSDALSLTRAELLAEAQAGTLSMAFTAALPRNFGKDTHRQPLISVSSNGDGNGTNPDIPLLPADNPMTLRAVDVRGDATIFWDGAPIGGTLSCVGGSFAPYCDSGLVQIDLVGLPPVDDELHLLQVQNPGAGLSAELPVCLGANISGCRPPIHP